MTMITNAEKLVRRAYHAAEGNVMDVQGFIDLFAHDGVFNAVGKASFRGEHLGDPVVSMAKLAPDVHRELHRVHVMGNVVAIELSIRGTFTGQLESPAGVIQPPRAKLDVPGADFWTARSGSSTATSASASCSNKWAYSPTSHQRSAPTAFPLQARSASAASKSERSLSQVKGGGS